MTRIIIKKNKTQIATNQNYPLIQVMMEVLVSSLRCFQSLQRRIPSSTLSSTRLEMSSTEAASGTSSPDRRSSSQISRSQSKRKLNIVYLLMWTGDETQDDLYSEAATVASCWICVNLQNIKQEMYPISNYCISHCSNLSLTCTAPASVSNRPQ